MTKSDFLGIIFTVASILVSIISLCISKEALKVSVANQQKIYRIECYEKVSSKAQKLIESYEEAHFSAEGIYDNLENLNEADRYHTDFQNSILIAKTNKKNIIEIVESYGAECTPRATEVFESIDGLHSLLIGEKLKDMFGVYNPTKAMENEINIKWLLDESLAKQCCTSGK